MFMILKVFNDLILMNIHDFMNFMNDFESYFQYLKGHRRSKWLRRKTVQHFLLVIYGGNGVQKEEIQNDLVGQYAREEGAQNSFE